LTDSANPRLSLIRLFDTYGALLTAHQRRIVHLYLEEDWSYGEIAEREGVSRTAVYDLIRRSRALLEHHEQRLQLVAREQKRSAALATLRARLQPLNREPVAVRRALEHLA
jgi:predicted DNA-binding protein YlxM (UPF0122 family)